MQSCNEKSPKCISCPDHFQRLRPLVKEIVTSNHFLRDAPDFDVNKIVDCDHLYFTRLHKFEETIGGSHIFRALKNRLHIVYAIDKNYRLIFLRAFDNYNAYKKFLEDKRQISGIIENI